MRTERAVGSRFGFATLTAAGFGQIVSDTSGVLSGRFVPRGDHARPPFGEFPGRDERYRHPKHSESAPVLGLAF